MGAIHVASTSTPSDPRPVTRGSKATLSPDGRTIYYVAQGTNPPGIFAVSVDGGAPRRLTSIAPSGPYVPYALSRDGRQIAYFTRADARSILSTISTAGGSPTEVVRLDSREELVPSWSPDGARLAYTHGTGLFVISASGGAPVRVAQLAGWDGWSVRWSPDGQYVAAFGWPEQPVSGEQNSVYVVSAQGGELQRLTTAAEPGYKEGLEWHPDGRRLSYMYYGHDGRGDETRIAYLDGSPTTHLLDQPYPIWDYLGVWDPSGRTYYFNASTRGTWGLYALGESGGAARTVWLQSGVSPGASLPSFSRDGRTMVWTVEQTTRQLWSVDTTR
jgi:Tol biopolymer transport system component